MYKRKIDIETIRNRRYAFCTAGVRRNDDRILPIDDIFAYILENRGLSEQIVDGNIEKAL